MDWNKLVLVLFELALSGYFLWCWHEAAKTGVITIKMATECREREPRGFLIVRWICLVAGVAMGASGLHILVSQH